MEPNVNAPLPRSDETKGSKETPAHAAPSRQQSVSSFAKNITERAIHFLSHASNETLGACLVGLGASTYFILGRVGLLLIGLCGGVVLHSYWGSNGQSSEGELARRKETGLDIAKRVLEWRERSRKTLEEDLEIDTDLRTEDNFSMFGSETADALNALVDATIRDYVRWWYSPILPTENNFPTVCRKTLTNFILGISLNVSRKRPADAFLEFSTNSSSIIIVILNELSAAIAASPYAKAQDAVTAYIKAKPNGSLGNIMDRNEQKRKLILISDDILNGYLDPEVYGCTPARVFLRQMLMEVVMEMTIDRCSKADWINDWIVYLLEEGEPELMKEIDAGVGGSTGDPASVAIKAAETVNAEPNGSADVGGSSHQRTRSRAEEAMEEAMREAQRLTQLMAEEDAQRLQGDQQSSNSVLEDASDITATHVLDTPTSSQSDLNEENQQVFRDGADHDDDVQLSPSSPNTRSEVQNVQQETNTAVRPQDTFTLHKAGIAIFDDGAPNDRRAIKSKPTIDYLIQIEPALSTASGWMIPRIYADFETLHEVLRRIAAITGIDFAQKHPSLPPWKGATKAHLREELERYLLDAISYEQLAESEGMKRFLDKDRGLVKAPGNKSGLWPTPTAFENVGKGMLDVLTKAPKGVAGGGKAVIGGVSSAFSGGAKRQATGSRGTTSPTQRNNPTSSTLGESKESLHVLQESISFMPEGQQSSTSFRRSSSSGRFPVAEEVASATSSRGATQLVEDEREMVLPPPPSDMPPDYEAPPKLPHRPTVSRHSSQMSVDYTSVDGTSFFDVPSSPALRSPLSNVTQAARDAQQRPAPSFASSPIKSATRTTSTPPKKREARPKSPLNEQETQMAIELLFAVITELYTLSSAWQIRRTLLTAAKTFLLRPGNPQLENIRLLLQESIIDGNASDLGIATHVRKLRENTLPTEEELATWPAPLSESQSEDLRLRARKLLVAKGMPMALMSVMGAAASGEALGKVFDCLQCQEIARGLMFGLMMQSVKTLTQ